MSAQGRVTGVRRLLRPAAQTTYEKVFGTVYVGLMTNVLLAVAFAPLLAALAIVRDPIASWPFFVALSPLCAPALTGAFACFAALGDGGTAVVLRPFWAGYRRGAGRAALVWAGGAAAVSVLGLDAVVVARTGWGPALVPFFGTAAALVAAVTVAVLVLLAEPRDEPVRALLRPCVYLVARRWHLAALNIVVLGLAGYVVLTKPVIGVLLLGAPLLYLVWATTRYIVAPVHTPERMSTSM
ncbi:ferredoxin-NADPH reductase [Nonomuraea zeae]|uniref:Ferredoxin-NADPH reductase n=1 Tax=Nonomuraea zeae TaxID=1642303 RepID=A0A5S4G1L2_9ACTN|nr:ferredoxin-NADPH reductase [Nonomuraea zeae]TMR26856.1 ferredoxin-NADPH reductase [Nonomuraea zeae]